VISAQYHDRHISHLIIKYKLSVETCEMLYGQMSKRWFTVWGHNYHFCPFVKSLMWSVRQVLIEPCGHTGSELQCPNMKCHWKYWLSLQRPVNYNTTIASLMTSVRRHFDNHRQRYDDTQAHRHRQTDRRTDMKSELWTTSALSSPAADSDAASVMAARRQQKINDVFAFGRWETVRAHQFPSAVTPNSTPALITIPNNHIRIP